ncbi:MAG: toxin-antitoxin system HicB family antitoxin [Bacillota bacterium]
MAQDAKKTWLLDALNHGETIPEPVDEAYSGRILLRTPRSLHKELVERARREGVSLNQFMIYQLSKSLGRKV